MINLLSTKHPDRKWYEIILWWELRRLPYNILMYGVGMLSFYVAYVTIPLVYIFIGLLLNLLYTFGWAIELLFIKGKKQDVRTRYPAVSFFMLLGISTLLIFGFAFYLIL